MAKLKTGDKAPGFEGINQDGKTIRLADFAGKRLILYFYPKDNTPGCTAESCNLNDHYDQWLSKGYDIVGVSPDPVASHQKFRDKFGLRFNLIADTEKEILQAYGVWGEKSMYGRRYMGVMRTTFILDEQGIIREIIEKVNTKDHTNQMINILKF
ncbi:MAG: thioredoxin-dependent thiol peroxidase [Mariniphaga sp.]|nr:thioredoxin-dependent thiol peroxidase [Mariniphaga sp.]MDD4225059.1 thioredoxin-dependent thiol peroxidase [Mariniphaga sp.]MDD4425582.1 thioredoxin-dependent thiol peroxidase [Mariniphaga sp.]